MKLQDFITYLPPMRRWRPHWTAQISDLYRTGADREEANKNLFTHIKSTFTGTYNPAVIPFRGYIAHLWRDPEAGWCYSIKNASFSGPIITAYSVVGEYEQTEKYARSQLADFAYNGDITPEEAAEIILDDYSRSEFIHQCYRTKRVQSLMVEHGLDWQTASQIEDGLKPHPKREEVNP